VWKGACSKVFNEFPHWRLIGKYTILPIESEVGRVGMHYQGWRFSGMFIQYISPGHNWSRNAKLVDKRLPREDKGRKGRIAYHMVADHHPWHQHLQKTSQYACPHCFSSSFRQPEMIIRDAPDSPGGR
jgi:hypothetical protein